MDGSTIGSRICASLLTLSHRAGTLRIVGFPQLGRHSIITDLTATSR